MEMKEGMEPGQEGEGEGERWCLGSLHAPLLNWHVRPLLPGHCSRYPREGPGGGWVGKRGALLRAWVSWVRGYGSS